MDEILYLEPDEEITSVIDKIKNTKASRIGLVVPREATILQSVVNLRLLQKEADFLGKSIAIVTTDKIGRNLASQIGLEVFNSIEEKKPIYQPRQPIPDSNEVIELDTSPKIDESTKPPAGVQVHHFQEKFHPSPRKESFMKAASRPPVLSSEPPIFKKAKPHFEKPPVSHFLAQKEKDFKIFKKLLWPMAGILLVLIAISTYLLLPKATIKIYTPSDNLQKEVTFSVSSLVKNLDLNQNILPGQLLEVSDEKKSNFPATGQKTIGTKSSATITFYNNLDSNSHSLKSGTQLSSSSKTFILKSSIVIPGAGVSGGNVVPGSVQAGIEASQVGADYNVKAGRFTILGLSASEQAGIYGQSSKDLSGGMSRKAQVVSQQDYDNAKNKLISDLSTSLKKELDKKTSGKKILDKALVIPDPSITSSANVNDEAKSFDMNLKYKEQVIVFDNSAMKDFLVQILKKQVAQDKAVTIANDSDVGLVVKNTAYDKSRLDLSANVIAKVSANIDTQSIKNQILGKSSSSAESLIKGRPNISSITIDIWPAIWFKRIPNLSRNVDVKIEYVNK